MKNGMNKSLMDVVLNKKEFIRIFFFKVVFIGLMVVFLFIWMIYIYIKMLEKC